MEQLAKYGVSTSYQNLEKFVVHVHAETHARAPEMVNSSCLQFKIRIWIKKPVFRNLVDSQLVQHTAIELSILFNGSFLSANAFQ